MENSLRDNNLVEKSRSLVWAKLRSYTAGELRLLEVYLSRINPRDPDSSSVSFSFPEYRRLLGMPSLTVRNVRPQLDHFLGNVVYIPLPDKDGYSFQAYTLFTKAEVRKKNGNVYTITISCNPDLRPVFFDIAQTGYIHYRLIYTLSMKSQYSILLYSMIRDWIRDQAEITKEIDLDRLREQLGATDQSYQSFKNLKKRVLDRAVTEITEVSDVSVDYDKIKKGREIVAIVFHVKVKADCQMPTAQAETPQISTSAENTGTLSPEQQKPARRARSRVYGDVDWNAIAPELDPAAARKIADKIRASLKKNMPEIPTDQLPAAALDTLAAAYKALLPESKEPWPDNPAGYLYSIIMQDGNIKNYLPWFYLKK